MASSNKHKKHCRNDRKVVPQLSSHSDLIEIRPGRILNVRHLNCHGRNETLERELRESIEHRGHQLVGVSPIHLPQSHTQTIGRHLSHSTTSKARTNDTTCTDNNLNEDLEGEIGNISETELEQHKEVQLTERNETQIQGWVNNAENTNQTGKKNHVKPASMPGPQQVPNQNEAIPYGEDDVDTKHTTKIRKKNKGYRPFSAKSLSQTVISAISSDGNYDSGSDSETVRNLHLNSVYKNVTLFFIHGVAGSSEVWNAQLEFFAGLGVEVIAPDLIGHGMSHCPRNAAAYHFNEILKDMEYLFDKFCNRQNIVIGHSYGCAFAAVLGRRRARRVTKLVLISGGAPVPLAPQMGMFKLPACLLSCVKPCFFGRLERGAFYTKDSGASRTPFFDIPMYVLQYMMNGQLWPDGDELYHRWLSMPTLLLHGKHDKFVTLEEELEMEKAIYYSQLHVVDNASHMLMMDSPKQVNDILYTFIFQDDTLSTATHNSTFAR